MAGIRPRMRMRVPVATMVAGLVIALVNACTPPAEPPPPPPPPPPTIQARPSGVPPPTLPLASPLPTPSPLGTPSPPSLVDVILDELREGSLAYTPKTDMRQGDTTSVLARISLGAAGPELGQGLPNPSIEGLKISTTMVATLTSVEKNAFDIRAVTDEEQLIAPPYAEWKWDVTPLTHGDHGLHLSVRAIVKVDEAEKRRDYPSKDVTIHVKVNPGYVVASFFGNYWQWLLGSPIVLGVGAWCAARLRQKKKRHAGF